MKFHINLRKIDRTFRRKKLTEGKQDVLIQSGREQFKKLVDRGLTIPVAYL